MSNCSSVLPYGQFYGTSEIIRGKRVGYQVLEKAVDEEAGFQICPLGYQLCAECIVYGSKTLI